MSHRSQRAWAVIVIAAILAGGVAGYLPPGPLSARVFHVVLGALGGLILSILCRLAAEWLWHLDFHRVAHWAWMAGQAWLVGFCTWRAATTPDDMPIIFRVPLAFVLSAFFALALTVAWVLVYQLFRYRLPALIRRGVQKIHGRHALRG